MAGLDRREGKPAVPDDLERYLNKNQLNAYQSMTNSGWRMYFVRRPMFQHPMAVMINHEGTRIGVLEEEGHVDLNPSLELRG